MKKQFLATITIFFLANTIMMSGMEKDLYQKKQFPQQVFQLKRSTSLDAFNLRTTADENLSPKALIRHKSSSGSNSSSSNDEMTASAIATEFEDVQYSDQHETSEEEGEDYVDVNTVMLYLRKLFYPHYKLDIYTVVKKDASNVEYQKNNLTKSLKQLLICLKIIEEKRGKSITGWIETHNLTLERVADIFGIRSPKEYANFLETLNSEERPFIDKDFTSNYLDNNGEKKVFRRPGFTLLYTLLNAYTINEDTNQFDFSPLTNFGILKQAMPWAFREHKKRIIEKIKKNQQPYPTLWNLVEANLHGKALSNSQCISEDPLFEDAGTELLKGLLSICPFNEETQTYDTVKLTNIPTLHQAMPKAFEQYVKEYIIRQNDKKTEPDVKAPKSKVSWLNSKPAWCIYSAATVIGSYHLWELVKPRIPDILANIKPYVNSVF